LPAPGLSLRTILDTVLSGMSPPPRVALEANSLRLMSALAGRGRCIAFQTMIGIERELAAKSLVLIPLSDPLLPVDRFTIVRPEGRKATLAAAAFLGQTMSRLKTGSRK
jgi:DNA-binding transcriptional LysR family regulator